MKTWFCWPFTANLKFFRLRQFLSLHNRRTPPQKSTKTKLKRKIHKTRLSDHYLFKLDTKNCNFFAIVRYFRKKMCRQISLCILMIQIMFYPWISNQCVILLCFCGGSKFAVLREKSNIFDGIFSCFIYDILVIINYFLGSFCCGEFSFYGNFLSKANELALKMSIPWHLHVIFVFQAL